MRFVRYLSAVAAAASVMSLAAPGAMALTAQECSAKYKAAKAAKTLGDKSWNDFRKTECGAEAPAADAKPAEAPKTDAAAKPAKAATTAAVFPKAVAAKYASEKPSKARLHTCADQYNANKASNANGGLKWIQKGGGYWSECNKQLKG